MQELYQVLAGILFVIGAVAYPSWNIVLRLDTAHIEKYVTKVITESPDQKTELENVLGL